MQKWEYKCVYITGGYEKIEQELNRLGAEGWELTAWNSVEGFVFKRRK